MADNANVHVISLGCPKNTVDSERMLGLLGANEYVITAEPEDADIVIVNTCGFIEPAKEESIETILEASKLKQGGRCKGVVVTGCLSTRYEEELKEELSGDADLILTLREERDIVRHVDQLLGRTRGHYVDVAPRTSLTPKHWSYLRISDGCDHKCAFCAIPTIRGRHVSEPMEELVAEAQRLATAGVRELVLVAQDSVRYGADLYGKAQLVPLLEQLAAVDGIDWMRLMYTYPAFWTEPMLQFYADQPKMCKYVDMPLQHIADPVLVRMKRATTKKKTLDLLDTLRQRMPGVGLRSSFIVGFPGESDADFEELLNFVESTRFDNATCFLYSDEEGTPAFELDGKLPAHVVRERYRRFTEVQERISGEINHALVGTRQTVLIDAADEMSNALTARLQRDAPEIDGHVLIETEPEEGLLQIDGSGSAGAKMAQPAGLVGRFAEVEITGAYPYELMARLSGEIW
ncbi:MAG TPA: 30S ribosomal protein S12 methylthiotransferase RimO [Candidatus Latescibacteria bacterium]|jgi:ribosomal protein S12 methylthiotransferase|nr:30S ribosomal protein S12 methylthiotransferase RimO [Candidatus Latescibacterota bacterium]|tara:strand:- start:438 stop:1823 length:1386 start_codon:yes stop_codon:yes gene_type:complete